MRRSTGAGLLARLREPALRGALEILSETAARRVESLYLAGGCVRDLLLGRRLGDLDLVVEGDPLGLAREAAVKLGGEAHGPTPFVTCRIEGPAGLRVDVAMSRRERYRSVAALPEVAPAPIEEDLLRRDFTMNSLAVALTGPARGDLLDPSGGLADLRAGRLRLQHSRSLVDDPTRAFRAARYASRYGFVMSRGWRAALNLAVGRGAFRRLTHARMAREVALLFGEPHPLEAVARAARWRLLELIDPALHWSAGLRSSLARALEPRDGESSGVEQLCLTLLVRAAPVRARARIASRLGFAGAAARNAVRAAGSIEDLRRRMRASGGGSTLGGKLMIISRTDPLSMAVTRAAAPPGLRREVEDLRRRWADSRPRLAGDDVMALGVRAGPAVGRALHTLRMARAEGRLRSRSEEVRFVRALIRRSIQES